MSPPRPAAAKAVVVRPKGPLAHLFCGGIVDGAHPWGRTPWTHNRVAECEIRLDGEVQELHQREYKGKRIILILTDDKGRSIKTKVDIGVHGNKSIEQVDFQFKVIPDNDGVVLLVNPKEQIFTEKLKSLLKLGVVSTRYKDVYDMFYLSSRIDSRVLGEYIRMHIFEDGEMLENDMRDIEGRLGRIFSSKTFLKRMSNPDYAWLDVAPEKVAADIVSFISSLG